MCRFISYTGEQCSFQIYRVSTHWFTSRSTAWIQTTIYLILSMRALWKSSSRKNDKILYQKYLYLKRISITWCVWAAIAFESGISIKRECSSARMCRSASRRSSQAERDYTSHAASRPLGLTARARSAASYLWARWVVGGQVAATLRPSRSSSPIR